ncbi:MAG: hypothetical protein FWG75_03850 [Cystobacterineae bacterium]|nr:hypothetical protein [Cystobacterineae bacterium]
MGNAKKHKATNALLHHEVLMKHSRLGMLCTLLLGIFWSACSPEEPKVPSLVEHSIHIVPEAKTLSPLNTSTTFSVVLNSADAEEAELSIGPVTGLSFGVESSFAEGSKNFVVTVRYDGETTFAEGLASIHLTLTGTTHADETPSTHVSIMDGQEKNRPIPVEQENMEAFNTYARTPHGLTLHYQLTENLRLPPPATNQSNWVPIGTEDSPFTGSFDGKGHTIEHLTIRSGTEDNVGLFGYLNGAQLSNIALENVELHGEHIVGSIAANMVASTLSNSYSTGKVSAPGRVEVWGDVREGVAGGIVGEMRESTLIGSNSAVELSGQGCAGGIVGHMWENSTLTNSHNTGELELVAGVAGGIAGDMDGESTISGSYNTGNIAATFAGGIVGRMSHSAITKTYNTGKARGADYAGGIAGKIWGSTLSSSYNVGEVHAQLRAGGIAGYVTRSTLSNNYSTGPATAAADEAERVSAGGIVGLIEDDSTITNSYSTGEIRARDSAGGIAGDMRERTTLSHCVAINSSIHLTGATGHWGRVVGFIGGATVESNVAWEGLLGLDGNPVGDSAENGEAKTSEALRALSTYAEPAPGGLGWEFSSTWKMPAGGGYPLLFWE